MKLIRPSFEIWEQTAGLEGIYKQIERAGRVCYKSEDKITENSAKSFVDRMVASGHGAMLEHGTVYLQIHWNDDNREEFDHIYCDYSSNPYSKVVRKVQEDDLCPTLYVTTNYRVLVEHDWLNDLEYLCEPTEYHAKRITVYFTCDRVTGESFLRHRVFSFARESTRYCNYSKDKFGNEVTFIIPNWCDDIPENLYLQDRIDVKKFVWGSDNLAEAVRTEGIVNRKVSKFTQRFLYTALEDEETYIGLVNAGYTPQQARIALPFAVKSPLVMTGFVDDWWGEYSVIDKATGLIDQRIHGKFYGELNNIDRDKYRVVEKGFFPLRCSKRAHPQAQELAIPLREEFINKKIW